jgi:hypothetical protein
MGASLDGRIRMRVSSNWVRALPIATLLTSPQIAAAQERTGLEDHAQEEGRPPPVRVGAIAGAGF